MFFVLVIISKQKDLRGGLQIKPNVFYLINFNFNTYPSFIYIVEIVETSLIQD